MPIRFFRTRSTATEADCLEFKNLCERVSVILQSSGIHTLPYLSPDVPRFQQTHDAQRILPRLRIYTEVLEAAHNAGDDLRNDSRLVWRMLRVMGYVPREDIFDRIENGDTVEIYTTDNMQVFRNLRCFECVSMTVEEIFTFKWNRDSRREGKITWKMLDIVLRFKLGILNRTIDLTDIPEHTMEELIGKRWKVSIRLKHCSPLKQDGKVTALLVTNSSRVLLKS